MKVKATDSGFYGIERKRRGMVFDIKPEHFSKKWMAKVDAKTPVSYDKKVRDLKKDATVNEVDEIGKDMEVSGDEDVA